MNSSTTPDLLRTPLHALHLELGAKMVGFGGYDMPVQYSRGIIAEHLHTRTAAGLFDVSHMGQVSLRGDAASLALESLVPVDVLDLPLFKQRYALFTNTQGGILDDLMITRRPQDLFVVVNAACKAQDLDHLQEHLGARCTVQALPEQALLALQGPLAVSVLSRLNTEVSSLKFMTGGYFDLNRVPCFVTRSGYTGEDGFEISVPAEHAQALARALLGHSEVQPIGLGARDTLRLEAGLCLYGHDITTTTTPIEAGLSWAIQKSRRSGGARAGGYPGAAVIDAQLSTGVSNRRVGLVGLERAPVREGTSITDARGHSLGVVTSGTLGPSIQQPIAMAYLPLNHTQAEHEVYAQVRGKALPMRVRPMPFVPNRYQR